MKIIDESKHISSRQSASLKIISEEILSELAKRDNDEKIRLSSISKIKSEELLEDISLNGGMTMMQKSEKLLLKRSQAKAC